MSKYITVKEYAELKGCSLQAVYKRLDGSLKDYVVLDGKRKLLRIEVLDAMRQVENNPELKSGYLENTGNQPTDLKSVDEKEQEEVKKNVETLFCKDVKRDFSPTIIVGDKLVIKSNDFGDIRTASINNETWFAAADVCRALDLDNPTKAMLRLDEDEFILTSTADGVKMNFVSEPGLYSLIMGSRKPEAKAFKRWVTHEVLPVIHKYGMYTSDDELEKAVQTAVDAILAKEILPTIRQLQAQQKEADEINNQQKKKGFFQRFFQKK